MVCNKTTIIEDKIQEVLVHIDLCAVGVVVSGKSLVIIILE